MSQPCSKSSSAVGRRLGSLAKHWTRKLESSGEQRAGIGGCSSSTMRNMADMAFISAYGGLQVMSSMMRQARDQMSDAVDAPRSSITSGATEVERSQPTELEEEEKGGEGRTPVWGSSNIGDVLLDVLNCVEVERDSKVAELDVPALGAEDVGRCERTKSVPTPKQEAKKGEELTFKIAMHHSAAVEVRQSLEDLDDVRRDERLWQLSKVLKRLLQRSVLDVPASETQFSTHPQENNERRTRG